MADPRIVAVDEDEAGGQGALAEVPITARPERRVEPDGTKHGCLHGQVGGRREADDLDVPTLVEIAEGIDVFGGRRWCREVVSNGTAAEIAGLERVTVRPNPVGRDLGVAVGEAHDVDVIQHEVDGRVAGGVGPPLLLQHRDASTMLLGDADERRIRPVDRDHNHCPYGPFRDAAQDALQSSGITARRDADGHAGSLRHWSVPASSEPSAADVTIRHVKRMHRRLADNGWRVLTSPLRRLPDFLIIGVQKGGTTSLYDYLCQHARVSPAAGKGLHFFEAHHGRGRWWYRSRFPIRGDDLSGEATPDYMDNPYVPARAAALVPDVKLIAVLRDPTDRALSHYFHNRARGREPLSLHDALDAEEERLAAERASMGDDDAQDRGNAHRHFGYRRRGEYASHLRRWLAHFPREQLLILRSEDLFTEPAGVVRRTTDFLGLPPIDGGRYSVKNEGLRDEVDPDIVTELRAHFAPFNVELAELTGERWWSDS